MMDVSVSTCERTAIREGACPNFRTETCAAPRAALDNAWDSWVDVGDTRGHKDVSLMGRAATVMMDGAVGSEPTVHITLRGITGIGGEVGLRKGRATSC